MNATSPAEAGPTETLRDEVERMVPRPGDAGSWFPYDPAAAAASFRFAARRVLEIDNHDRRARLLQILSAFARSSRFPDWCCPVVLDEIGRSHGAELGELERVWRYLLLEEVRDGRRVA